MKSLIEKTSDKLVNAFLKNKIISPIPSKFTKNLKEAQKLRLLCENKIKHPVIGFKAAGTGIPLIKKFKEKVINDFRTVSLSRETSVQGRREVLLGKGKFGEAAKGLMSDTGTAVQNLMGESDALKTFITAYFAGKAVGTNLTARAGIVVNPNLEVLFTGPKLRTFQYNFKFTPRDLIFLSASFKGKFKRKDIVKKEMEILKKKKDEAQPTQVKTGGSTFKNPIEQTNTKVWKLIKSSVPKNTTFGDATISDKHSNFFVNKNNATFNDMKQLINFVKKNVKKKTGINLDLEIEIVG